MDAKVSTKTKTKTFQNLNKNCPYGSRSVRTRQRHWDDRTLRGWKGLGIFSAGMTNWLVFCIEMNDLKWGLTKLNSEYVHHMASPSLNSKPRDFGPIRLEIFFEKTIMICLKNQGFGKQNWGHHVLVYQYFVKIQKTPLLKALWCPLSKVPNWLFVFYDFNALKFHDCKFIQACSCQYLQ